MTVADIIARFFSRRNDRNEIMRQMKNERVATKVLDEREKDSNERELERYMEEKRKARIKHLLMLERKRRQSELWHGKNIYKHKRVFRGKATLLENGNMLKNERSMLHWRRVGY